MNLADLKLRRVNCIDDLLDFRVWLGERRHILAVDTENAGLNVGLDPVRLFQVGDSTGGWAFDWLDWKGACVETMSQYDRPVVFHNALYDLKFLRREGLTFPQHLVHDTLPMCWLKSPIGPVKLKPAATKYVDRRASVGQGLLEQGMSANGWTWATVPTDYGPYWMYGVLDTCLTAILAEKIYPEIRDSYLYAYELEMAVIHCLVVAELAGLLVDEDARLRTEAKLRQELTQLRAFEIPSELDKPTSDKQVIKFLQDIGAGQHLIFKTEKGNISVDKEALAYVAKQGFPVAQKIADFRSRTNTLNNYVMKFADSYMGGLASDHVLRCNTHPIQARTGRMSITEPPLQTLPRGRVVRDCIIARPGHRFVMADFQGMEVRAIASLSQDEGLLGAFERGDDPHGFTAEAVYGAGWTKQQRTTAKNGNFCMIYGGGVEKVALTAGIDIDVAQAFMLKHGEMFPAVHKYMDTMINEIREKAGRGKWGYVELQDGRRLPVEKDKAYTATNYRIQGGCAVTLKERIVAMDHAGMGDWLRLPVHDECLYEVPHEHVREARHIVDTTMPDHSWPGITMEIDRDEVSRWGRHYREDYAAYIETEPEEWECKLAA